MKESERVPEKGRFRASMEKYSRGVPEKRRISVSTEKWENPGAYLQKVDSVRVSKNFPDEYRKRLELVSTEKMVESGRVPGKGRFHASIEKLSRRVPKEGRISVSTEKW